MAELAFLWHMHQPDYRHPETGEFVLPWVLLHAIKDYADMACHLERHPGVRATVNFVPVLLDQVDDYSAQFASGQWRDPLLRVAAASAPEAISAADRQWLLDLAFRCYAPTMLEPFAPFRRLRDLYRHLQSNGGNGIAYLSGTYFTDLATWMLLTWSGESLRRFEAPIAGLMARGEGFTLAERQALLASLGRVVSGLVPRYRALVERGQVEISCTPQAHPLAPLLLDFASAREAWPDCPLPAAPGYPGGRSRVEAHLDQACNSHIARFGVPAQGLWPAEGALSEAFLNLIGQHELGWVASSHGVLRHSAGHDASPYQPWRAPAGGPEGLRLFFRDERLSDLIGFEYAKWHGRDAAQDFVANVTRIARSQPQAVIPVFLDGENAWEYYPYNGWYFFDDLYSAIEAQQEFRTTTLADAARDHRDGPQLPRLVAGSWVYGTLSTWVGNPDKNRAWELLCEAKQSADRALGSGHFSAAAEQAIRDRLTVCESSDWFWWFGDYNPGAAVADFDALFRANLRALYRLLALPEPPSLGHPLCQGGGHAESGGTMRRATA
ncbi:MAG: hypothetical protein RIR00_219 [Pseudomonadota bacterium]|jgi:alpha-amylase/alpha-mannosidase (GH57 family)